MARHLLDTNIVLRLCNTLDERHSLAVSAVAQLIRQSDECVLATQVLAEFWVVATRPIEVNGLGFSSIQTRKLIEPLLKKFTLLEDTSKSFTIWLDLVTEQNVLGKRAHDIRLAATLLAHGITHLVTFNPKDFEGIAGITVVVPQNLIPDEESSVLSETEL